MGTIQALKNKSTCIKYNTIQDAIKDSQFKRALQRTLLFTLCSHDTGTPNTKGLSVHDSGTPNTQRA